jgi:hypothetical protein
MGRSPLRVAGAAAVAAVAIVAAGCGSSASPSASSVTTTTTTPGTGASTATLKAFQDCMAQHGVKNFTPGAGRPQGGGNGGGLSSTQQQAFTACRSKLPAGARPGGGGPGGNRANNPAFAKYTACLKQHGVTLGGSNSQKAFATASAACAKYRPAPGGATQQ